MSSLKTVLVTGGCGFIGSYFVHALLQRTAYQVVNLDKLTYAGDLGRLADVEGYDRYTFVKGDIGDAEDVERSVARTQPWAVVNFAAESHVDRSILDPTPFLRTNVLGVQVLLDAARRHRVERFVQVSTDEVYGGAEGAVPFSEDAPLRPSSPYAASKAAADLLCLAYHRTHAVPVVIARSANNYGPFQFPEKLIPLMIRNAMAGEPLPLYGDGGQVRDWLYIEDNCEALWLVLERGLDGEIYNIGTEQHRTNLEVVRALCEVIAKEAHRDERELLNRISFIPDRPGHDRRYALSAAKIRGALGWMPRTSFEEGLRRTVPWYLGHEEWIRRATSLDYQAYYDAVYRRFWSQTSS